RRRSARASPRSTARSPAPTAWAPKGRPPPWPRSMPTTSPPAGARAGRHPDPPPHKEIAVHDLVIDNARIVDGLGTPARDVSLAVKDGRIAAIGAGLGQASA